MDPKTISEWFPLNPNGEQEAIGYLKDEDLYELICHVSETQEDRIAPKFRDLARIHKIIRKRKIFSALEFGVGFSTLVLADALKKNEFSWKELAIKPEIYESNLFRLYSVDGDAKWIEPTRQILPSELKDRVHFYVSSVMAGKFNDKLCHHYEVLPDIVPDFLYIDGPDPATVRGDMNGQSWKNTNRVVMSADLLSIETTLMPGALVLVDGRTSNARFLAAHLYRNWSIYRNPNTDVSLMELQEQPVGRLNYDVLKYQLGEHVSAWTEPLLRIGD